MSSMPNPVERRLLDLCDLWSQFVADTSKRLLVWQLQDNAVRIVDAFIEVQKHQTDYTTGDLFLSFDVPFESSLQYSRAVKAELLGRYEASREDLLAQGLAVDWSFQPHHTADNAAGVMEALRSFGSRYHRSIGHLAAVFTPESISDGERFAAWLRHAIDAQLPERLRLVTLDSLEYPRLKSLLGQPPPVVCVQKPAIDTLEVAQETFAQEKTSGPAGVFRNLMMGVVTLLEKGSADEVKVKAGDALAFCRKQQWLDQEVALRLMVAGALLKESRHEEAIQVYRGARTSAEAARVADHPAGARLVLQTWFGEAGAHLAANDARAASLCYDAAATEAVEANEILLAIEAHRMSGFCLARIEERLLARKRLGIALDLGQRLKPQSRAMTTLPIAAVDLLRVLDAPRVVAMQEIRQRIDDRLAHAAQQLDAGTQSLVQSGDSALLEQRHQTAVTGIEQEGAGQLEKLVAQADPSFIEAFEHARELLGPGWPLDNTVALPPPFLKQEAAA